MSAPIDTATLQAQIDLRELVGRTVALRKHTRRELCGPCPKCGGRDRFFVAADYWGCRQCETGGDAIAYMMWLHNVDFLEAVAMLAPNAPVRSTPAPARTPAPPPVQSRAWIERMTKVMGACVAALLHTANAGADYLTARGLTPATWQAFGIGYDAKRNAIALPWFRRGELWGVRYRLLNPPPNADKLISELDSMFAGLLFGGMALPLRPDSPLLAQRSLLIVEGEINAMSVWQAGAPARCDVLSLGGPWATIPDSLLAIAARYRSRIVWMDKESIARRNAQALDAAAFWSQKGDDLSTKRDANDHLRDGTLGPLLAAMLQRATPPEHAEGLHWDLYDAGLVSA